MVLPRFRDLQIQHGYIAGYEQATVFWKVCSGQTLFTHLKGMSYPYPDLGNIPVIFLSGITMGIERQAQIVVQYGQLRRLW